MCYFLYFFFPDFTDTSRKKTKRQTFLHVTDHNMETMETITGVQPTVSSSQSAILPNIPYTSNQQINTSAHSQAMGLPSPQRMEHWNLDGKLISSPISNMTDGTRSLIEHSLEQHIEFRRLQRTRMEHELETSLNKKRIELFTSSIGTLRPPPGHGPSSSSSIENGNNNTTSTSSLSYPNGSVIEKKASLTSSFRPRSASANTSKQQPQYLHKNNSHLLNQSEVFSQTPQTPLKTIVMKRKEQEWEERERIEQERAAYDKTRIF